MIAIATNNALDMIKNIELESSKRGGARERKTKHVTPKTL